MRLALAILTYDRDPYLSLVLPSILSQRVEGRPVEDVFDLYVFQDGLCREDSRSSEAGHRRVGEMLGKLPSFVQVLRQQSNLGVALHFDLVEKLLFREKRYDFVLFCEDDLVLSPQYLEAMVHLAKQFRGDERIGMLSAHPIEPTADAEKQRASAGDYAAIGHNWGFGIYREFWEERQPFVERYLELIKSKPYRQRPTDRVLKWLDACGFQPQGSSQDFIKQCATAALGRARVSTAMNLALPIGRSGLHCRPELFAQMGFDRTVVHDQPAPTPSSLTDRQFRAVLASQQSACLAAANEFPAPDEWRAMVGSGAVDPERVLGPEISVQPAPRAWAPHEIPVSPHMVPEALDVFDHHLTAAKAYLEYGAGGSTIRAGELGVPAIYSVESDPEFLNAVQGAFAQAGSQSTLLAHYVDIGPVAEWGNPRDKSKATSWPLYASSIWRRLVTAELELPDLVLIDGRFRIACFLATLTFAKPGTTILFDDYGDRPNYHVVEKYLRPTRMAGRLAEFITVGNPGPEAMLDLMMHSTDVA